MHDAGRYALSLFQVLRLCQHGPGGCSTCACCLCDLDCGGGVLCAPPSDKFVERGLLGGIDPAAGKSTHTLPQLATHLPF